MAAIDIIAEPGTITYLSRDGRSTHQPSGPQYSADKVPTSELACIWAEMQAALEKIEPELIRRGFPIFRASA